MECHNSNRFLNVSATIPVIGVGSNDGVLDVLVNGESVVDDKIATIKVPEKTSDLINDTKYLDYDSAEDLFNMENTILVEYSYPQHNVSVDLPLGIEEIKFDVNSTAPVNWTLYIEKWNGDLPMIEVTPFRGSHTEIISTVGNYERISVSIHADSKAIGYAILTYKQNLKDLINQCVTKEELLNKLSSYATNLDLERYALKDDLIQVQEDVEYLKKFHTEEDKYTVEGEKYAAIMDSEDNWTVYTFEDGKIPANKFESNKNIYAVELGDGIVSIGNWAFGRCSNLKSVKFGSGLTTISISAFNQCDIREVELNEGLLRLGNYAFNQNYHLESVKLPSTLVQIDLSAFANCM